MERILGAPARLHSRGPSCRGVVVDIEGAMLGPECILVRRTPSGYRSLSPSEAADVLRAMFHEDRDRAQLFRRCQRIAKALEAGDLVRAQLLGLEFRIAALDEGELQRLGRAAGLIKADFDPDEARDERGRWTSAGPGEPSPVAEHELPGRLLPSASSSDADVSAEPAADPQPRRTEHGLRGRLLPAVPVTEAEVSAELAEAATEVAADGAVATSGIAAATAAGATVILVGAILLKPWSKSNVYDGSVPDRPDLSYHYDEGVLSLYQTQEDGNRKLLYSGMHDANSFYVDGEGRVIGQDLTPTYGVGAGVMLSATALDLGNLELPKERSGAAAANDNDTYRGRCPALTYDPSEAKMQRDPAAYQEQITRLPPGFVFLIKGVKFDGCAWWSDGHLLEAKKSDYANLLVDGKDGKKDWIHWWTGHKSIMEQVYAQSIAAWPRQVVWHFSNRQVADYYRHKFLKYNNVEVYYTPFIKLERLAWSTLAMNSNYFGGLAGRTRRRALGA